MNGYELVKKWVEEEKRVTFSNNEFKSFDEKIALTILKEKYNARYQQSFEPYCCGNWLIDNPFCEKIDGLELLSCDWDEDEFYTHYIIESNDNAYENFAKEIERIDGGNKEEIKRQLQIKGIFLGEKRFWRIRKTKIYKKT